MSARKYRGASPPPAKTHGVRGRAATLILAALALLSACGEKTPAPTDKTALFPETLDEWSVLEVHDGVLELKNGALAYDLATPLFSDYALKLRTISLPPGTAATYDNAETFDLPVGTIITKTFYYPTMKDGVTYGPERTARDGVLPLAGLRLMETRVLHRREDGWVALPYVWNAEGTRATLQRAGALIETALHRADGLIEPLSYFVPNANQCAGCHATNNTTRKIEPIGLKARHLNKPSIFASGVNQLDHWRLSGILAGDFSDAGNAPRNASWTDRNESLDARARAYLDINCSHCHSNVGPADTSGLDLRPDVPEGPKIGRCKSTIAAGAGAGGRRYDIVPGKPEDSILVFRLETTDPAAMMPELGRSLAHEEGVALISAWIAEMAGGCG